MSFAMQLLPGTVTGFHKEPWDTACGLGIRDHHGSKNWLRWQLTKLTLASVCVLHGAGEYYTALGNLREA